MGPSDKESGDSMVDSQDKSTTYVTDKPQSLAQSYITPQNNMKTPKQLYMDKVEALGDAQLKQQLKDLYELGFVSFETNKGLVEKYKDLNKVAEILFTGGLNESAISAVYGGGQEQ